MAKWFVLWDDQTGQLGAASSFGRRWVRDFFSAPFWPNIPDKPFESLGSEFSVSNGQLQVASIDFSKILNRKTSLLTVDSELTPDTDNTYDLGVFTKRWRNGYFAGTVDAGSLNIEGTTVIDSSRRVLNVSDIRFLEGEYSSLYTHGSVIGFFNPDIRNFGDALQFNPPDSVEYLSGGTWYSISVPKDIFMGAKISTFAIKYGWEQVRFTWTNFPYTWFEALYMYYDTRGHKMIVEVQRSADGTNWETIFTSEQIQGRPAHYTHVKFWHNGDYPYLRIVITPIWNENYPNQSIDILNIRYFASYPGYASIRLYDWDADRNLSFYGFIDAPSLLIGGTQIVDSNRNLKNIASISQNWLPASDNTYDLGSSTLRWRNLYAVNVYAGDVVFQNGWRVTEYDENGRIMNGLRVLNKDGEEILRITESGIYFKGQKLN